MDIPLQSLSPSWETISAVRQDPKEQIGLLSASLSHRLYPPSWPTARECWLTMVWIIIGNNNNNNWFSAIQNEHILLFDHLHLQCKSSAC